MACCGQKRAQVSQRRSVVDPPRPIPAPARPGPRAFAAVNTFSSVALRYLRHDPLTVRGPRTGRVYSVSGTTTVVTVHADDAPALLRTGLFTSEGA